MNKIETKKILDIISAIDNRKVAVETIEAWHMVIGFIPYEIAIEALRLAQQDVSVKYLEPRHIVSWAKEAAFRLDRDQSKKPELFHGTPEPTCKHADRLLNCNKCCYELYKHEDLTNAQLLIYAKENVYA
jgi:phytoene dehydrogenase-like protein